MDAQKTSTWTNLLRILTNKESKVKSVATKQTVKTTPAEDIDWEAVPAQ